MEKLTGVQFKQALKLLGWSQWEFARKMAMDKNTITRWVVDNKVPMWASQYMFLAVSLGDFCNEVEESMLPTKRKRRKPRIYNKGKKDKDQLELAIPDTHTNGHANRPVL